MKTLAILVGFCVAATAMNGAEQQGEERSGLQRLISRTASEALAAFSTNKLSSNQLAITLIDLATAERGSFRGSAPIYPASVVKLFYLAAAHQWMADGKLQDSAELRRALRDMIVDSSNDATHYVLDVLTGTTGGPELPEPEMKLWSDKRNAVNRYFTSLGYTNINVNQKPWCEGPYGRERVFVGKDYSNRNALTTDATARLLAEIASEKAVSPEHSREMLELLSRSRKSTGDDADPQALSYTALGLPDDALLWSKAGWTSTARHDAAYVKLKSGRRFILVTFTTGHANEREIIGFIARKVVAGL